MTNITKLKQKGDIPGLIKLMQDEDIEIKRRNDAIKVLGKLDDTRAIESLVSALKNKGLCQSASDTLVKIDKPVVEPLIVVLRDDEDWSVPQAAAEALGKLRGPRAIEPLIVVLKEDGDGSVRRAAVHALRQTDDTCAREVLKTIAKPVPKTRFRSVGERRVVPCIENDSKTCSKNCTNSQ